MLDIHRHRVAYSLFCLFGNWN